MTVSPDSIGRTLSFIASANQELRKQRYEDAVILFCKGYALEPGLIKDHLLSLPQNHLHCVICTMEDWCVCYSTESQLGLLDSGVTVTIEQICDLITSPGLRPDSRVAWTTKLRIQMRNKSYREAVKTCGDALKIFANHTYAMFFLVERAMAYLLVREKGLAVKDLMHAYDKDMDAALSSIKESAAKIMPVVLEALYEVISIMAQKSGAYSMEERLYLVKIDRIVVGLNPTDYGTLEDCASHMIKLNQFKAAVALLSDGIDSLSVDGRRDGEALELFLHRAQCHLALNQTELAVDDYLSAMIIDDDITRITILALSSKQQDAIASIAKKTASDFLTHHRLKAKLSTACSVDSKMTADSLQRAALMYRLLYLLDSNNVDALVNAAECMRLQDNDREAIKTLNLVLELRPTCSKAYYARAFCYMKSADMSNALADFSTTLDLQHNYVQAFCGRAFVWLMSGQLEKAAIDLKSASEISTAATVTWITELSEYGQETLKNQLKEYLLMTSKKRQGCADTSLIPLGDVLTRAFSTDFECHLVFVEILQSQRKMDEAQAILVRLIKHNPDDYLATLHLAALKMRRNKTADALEDICALLKTIGEEKLMNSLLRLSEGDRARLTREAHCEGVQRFNVCSGDASAESYFSLAIAASPSKACESYAWRAKLRILKGEVDLAINDLSVVLNQKPNFVEALCQRGLLYAQKENLKASYHDLLQALVLNNQALKNFILSLHENPKQLLLTSLENCAQLLFSRYLTRGFRSKCILKLCQLLVEIRADVLSYHCMYADGLIIFEDYRKAAEELDIAEILCPEDVTVLSRSGLVHVKLNEVELSAAKFQRAAQIDSEAVKFALNTLNGCQKKCLETEALKRATELTSLNENKQALAFFTLAVAASSDQQQEVLRMRSKCFERLGRYQDAVDDMSAVITSGTPIVGDLITRANLHLLNDNVKGASLDFSVAMDTQEVTAVTLLSAYPGRDTVLKAFLRAAITDLNRKDFAGGLSICTSGLKLDPSNVELKNLKRKCEFGVSNKCFIQ
ncbi:PREDICTED: uncharacterized protein LOC107330634 [Acropora digitifera]|uniref:uncharacterized protein LOC107330634 n=1 Tax=Acropora digitifera TaxID=70779 RepID=UPI00077AE04E|nr:PREDICTED: uncharacterized protein LOC107330634 [Acropora digitifera]